MKVTENEIRKVVDEVIEESIKRLMEGDEETGSSSEESPDDSENDVDDDSGDVDVGGDDSSDEGKDLDSEEEINKLSDKVNQGFTAPKNLVLDDGTTTNIAVDSNDQNIPIDIDNDNYVITFEKGNWDTFVQSAQQYSLKVTTIRQTLIPLIEKALIELLETSGAYKRTSFDSTAATIDGDFRVTAEIHYSVELWIGTDFDKEAVQHDSGYIYQTISSIPGIKIMSTKIDTSTGDVQIIASI